MKTETKAVSLINSMREILSSAEAVVANPEGIPEELVEAAKQVVATRDDVVRVLRARGVPID